MNELIENKIQFRYQNAHIFYITRKILEAAMIHVALHKK